MYRVIQWATGTVGRQAIAAVAAHPEMELVGCYVTSPAKVGRDAGELAGIDALGVAATDDIAALCAMPADCVIHAPLPSARAGADPGLDLEVICRLLAAGKNVITVVGYVNPKVAGAEVVARLEAACAAGGTSIHGTGLHPGALAEVLPLVLSPLNTRIDSIVVNEAEQWGAYPSPQIVFDMMGMGKTSEEFQASQVRTKPWMDGLFTEAIQLIADGLGATLERVESRLDIELAESDFEIAAGPVARNTVVAQRFTWEGIVAGQARIVQRCVYRAAAHVAPHWGPVHGVNVRIEGRPGIEVTVGPDVLARGVVATAAHAVHSVPAVVAAAPGIRTALDLPLVTARYAMRPRRG